jgi:hypothetical protein
MSDFFMQARFNHYQNPDVKIFDFKPRVDQLQNQNDRSRCQIFLCQPELVKFIITMSKILMSARIDQDHNHDVEIFVASKRNLVID